MQDWKDILASMGGSVAPQGDESVSDETNVENAQEQKGPLHVILDKKGRKGKTATIVEGFELPDEEVAAIASRLKQKIGTGGSARGGEILLQGDWRQKIAELLRAEGFKIKI